MGIKLNTEFSVKRCLIKLYKVCIKIPHIYNLSVKNTPEKVSQPEKPTCTEKISWVSKCSIVCVKVLQRMSFT